MEDFVSEQRCSCRRGYPLDSIPDMIDGWVITRPEKINEYEDCILREMELWMEGV